MNTRQSNKLASYIAVEAVLKAHPEVETIPGLPGKVAAFSAKVAELHRLGEMQSQSIAGKMARRDELLGDMVRTSLEIAGVVLTVANEQKLTAIAPDVRLVPGDFARLRKEKRPWLARRVLEAARSVLTPLAPYGVTEETLSTLAAKIDAALEGLHQPRSTVADKQAVTRQLPVLVAEIDALLTESVDRLVLPLLNGSPRFYEAYRVARTIIDRRGRRRRQSEAEAPASTETSPSGLPGPVDTPSAVLSANREETLTQEKTAA